MKHKENDLIEIFSIRLYTTARAEIAIGIGYAKEIPRDDLLYLFVKSCAEMIGDPNADGKQKAILISFIISAAESLKISFPDLAAEIRKANIERVKTNVNNS